MPDVAMILNTRGLETQNGEEWTARAVGDILRNEIYKGLYEVGDISEHVPDYQIIDGDTFEEVETIRHRFQGSEASRAPMTDSRKEQAIERMREMYTEFRSSKSLRDEPCS